MSLALIAAKKEISTSQMCLAPELPTLAALDSALQASMLLLKFQYPENSTGPPELEEQIVHRIMDLSYNLREELLLYYKAVLDGN